MYAYPEKTETVEVFSRRWSFKSCPPDYQAGMYSEFASFEPKFSRKLL
jgi:hypothetical protein